MASGKKNAKGNKTAHVLNLLTAPGGGGAPLGEEESAAPESVQPGAPRPPPRGPRSGGGAGAPRAGGRAGGGALACQGGGGVWARRSHTNP